MSDARDRCPCGGELVRMSSAPASGCRSCGSTLTDRFLGRLDPTLTKVTTGYMPLGVDGRPRLEADRIEVAPGTEFPEIKDGQSRCMACDRPFTYPGVSPVQVGGSFYHPGCQPVAWEGGMRDVTMTAPWVREVLDKKLRDMERVLAGGTVTTTGAPVCVPPYSLEPKPDGPVIGPDFPTGKPCGSICPLHPEVVLTGGEACFKCCAWGVPE